MRKCVGDGHNRPRYFDVHMILKRVTPISCTLPWPACIEQCCYQLLYTARTGTRPVFTIAAPVTAEGFWLEGSTLSDKFKNTPKIYWNTTLLLFVKQQLGHHFTSGIGIQYQSAGLSPSYLASDLASCYCAWEGSSRQRKYLGPCHSYWRTEWNSWLLTDPELVVMGTGWANQKAVNLYQSAFLNIYILIYLFQTVQWKNLSVWGASFSLTSTNYKYSIIIFLLLVEAASLFEKYMVHIISIILYFGYED